MRLQSSRLALRTAARRLAHLYGLAILFVASGEAAVASESRDESTRWAPSLALFFDIIGQKAEGTVATSAVLGPPLDPFDAEQDALAPGNGCVQRIGTFPGPFGYSRDNKLCPTSRPDPTKIQPDDAGNDTSVVPLVGASLELMTPSLLGDAFLRPRAFVHGDIAAAFSYERNLAGAGSPGDFALPKGIVLLGADPHDFGIDELAIAGQGTRTRMQVRRWVYSAGTGVALTAEVFNRRIRVKPSFEYLREEVDFIGVANRAVALVRPSGVADLSGWRLISLTATERESYDGIGGGLELEVDTARLGPFVSSVYVMGRGYYLNGDRDVTMSTSNQFGENATWTAKLDPYLWRGGVGFRFRWSPEVD